MIYGLTLECLSERAIISKANLYNDLVLVLVVDVDSNGRALFQGTDDDGDEWWMYLNFENAWYWGNTVHAYCMWM